MIRRTRARLGAPSLAGALLLVAATATAQDLAPPPTGAPSTGAPPAGTAPSTGAAQSPEKKLDADEKKDSGRGLEWFYLNGDVGFSYINMASFSSSQLAITNASSQGPVFGLGTGIRLVFLSLGARASLNELSSFNLWQMDAELGFHIPIGNWEPYFGLHGGYCFVGALDQGISNSPSISISGGDAGLQLGFDYYFNHFVSFGVDLSAHALFLHRPPVVTLPAGVTLPPQEQADLQKTGDSVGFGLAPTVHLGFHL